MPDAPPPAKPPVPPPAAEPPDVESPAGTLTVEGTTTFENTVLAYERMLRVTEYVADAVARVPVPGRAAGDRTYVVVTADELEALALARQLAAALDLAGEALDAVAPAPSIFKSEAEDALTDAAAAAAAAAAVGAAGAAVGPAVALAGALTSLTGLAKHAIALAGLFRRDVTLTEVPVAVDDAAVQLAVAGELASQGLTVRCPTVFASLDGGGGDDGGVYAALGRAQRARGDAERRAAAVDEADRARVRAQLDAALPMLAAAERLVLGGDAGDSAAGRAAAAAAAVVARASAITEVLDEGAVLVRVHVLASGGARRVSRGLVGSADVQLSGGLVVNVAVFAVDGTLLGAGTWPNHSDFVEFGSRTRPVRE